MYVDQGGDVTITAISNKTGLQSQKVFTIGAGGLLKSLKILGPVNSYSSKKTVTVADGDENVALDYEALDVNGNQVTSYETIVRSTNSLILSAGQGSLTIKQENDGSAGIYWSDDKTVDFNNSEFFNNVARPVALTITVVGGDNKDGNYMLNVEDARRPAEIKNVAYNNYGSKALAVGESTSFAVDASWPKFEFEDQYGAALDKAIAYDFFAATKAGSGSTYGTDSSYYSIRRKTNETNTLGIAKTDIDLVEKDATGWGYGMTATAETDKDGDPIESTHANSLKWTIVKIKKADYDKLAAADQTVGSNWE